MKFLLAGGVLLAIFGWYLDSLVPPNVIEHRAAVVVLNSICSAILKMIGLLDDYGGYSYIDVLNMLPEPTPVYNGSHVTAYNDVIVGVPVRVYIPPNRNDNSAMIVYFHGGGFVSGSLNAVHPTVADMSNRTNAVIVSVDYKLAPEHPFPEGLNDCIAVTKNVMGNLGIYGIRSKLIYTAGDSAGGNFAAAVNGELAKEHLKLSGAILIYPVIQVATTALPSYDYTIILTRELMSKFIVSLFGISHRENWMAVRENRYVCRDKRSEEIFSKYLPGIDLPEECDERLNKQMQQVFDPRISVLFRENLADLAPTLFISAEVDVVHDEAVLYYNRLQQEGVPSELKIYKGAYHGFFSDGGKATVPSHYEAAMNDIVHFLNTHKPT